MPPIGLSGTIPDPSNILTHDPTCESSIPKSAVFYDEWRDTKEAFKRKLDGAVEIIERSPGGSKRRRLHGRSWDETFKKERPFQEAFLDYIALRCLIEELRCFFGGRMPSTTVHITKAQHLDIIRKEAQLLFPTLYGIQKAVEVLPDEKNTELLDFLSTANDGYFQVASSLVHKTNVFTVHTAAMVLECDEALRWLEILTNRDLEGEKFTKIHTLTDHLKKQLDTSGIIGKMEKAAAEVTNKAKEDDFKKMQNAMGPHLDARENKLLEKLSLMEDREKVRNEKMSKMGKEMSEMREALRALQMQLRGT